MSDMPIDPNLQENEDALNMAVVSGIVARIPFYSESRVKGKRQQYAAFTLKCRKYLKDDEFDEIRIKAYGMNAIYIKENELCVLFRIAMKRIKKYGFWVF